MSLREIRAAARRHPRVADAGIAGIVALGCGLVLTGRTGATVAHTDAVDWVSVVLLPVPLIWRRRAPVLVFAVATVLLVGSQAVGAQSPAALAVTLTALHAIARHRPARFAWPAAALTVIPGFDNRIADGPAWGAFAAVSAVTVTVVLIGMNQRTRSAYTIALEDRARRLEQERDQRAQLAVAEERARIAREMHDVVAHHLAVMVALSDGASATAAQAPQRAADVMGQVSATGRQALGEMRRLVGLLRNFSSTGTSTRTPQPGLDDIDALVERVRAAGLRVSLRHEGAAGAWGPGAGLAIYRIVQEALTNTLKHAGLQANAEVTLRYRPGAADVSVLDDGAGRIARQPVTTGRHGLTGMLERAAAYGGRLEAGPRAGPGWQVYASLTFDQTELVR
ncbi:sensor histidine kinase [Paractinoplanes rishiriensis]|uniref:histidine kinase n=1 Tax=Paractinoplanes rishiriensis TaxID=1050105 RepID=A0A919K5V5_9ACTN|nr:histidine kinase [Actinoplanes rishiriensis]GIF01431.1 two-component sensor histidine kinase [Actinoplanes rishiriensis]